MSDIEETIAGQAPKFDFSAFPEDTLFLDRRTLPERRDAPRAEAVPAGPPRERRARKERRRRVDPTTFEKQYTEDEVEFMNAIQAFKTRSGKTFPTHRDILGIAFQLGYSQPASLDDEDDAGWDEDASSEERSSRDAEPCLPA